MPDQNVRTKSIGYIEARWMNHERAIGIDVPIPEDLKYFDKSNVEFPDYHSLSCIESSDLKLLIIKLVSAGKASKLYLRGFRIKGRLSLEGMTGYNNLALPPIIFVECLFDEGVCFDSARLSDLKLIGCRFGVDRDNTNNDLARQLSHINIRQAKIEHSLTLSHLRPLDMSASDSLYKYLTRSTEEKQKDRDTKNRDIKGSDFLAVRLTGSEFTSTFNIGKCCFIEKLDDLEKEKYSHVPSLCIRNSRFGNLASIQQSEFAGGIAASRCVCESEFWIASCFITDALLCIEKPQSKYEHALDFQNAEFNKTLYLSMSAHSSTVDGNIFLVSTKAAEIYIEGLRTHGYTSIFAAGLEATAMYLSTAYAELNGGESSNESSSVTNDFSNANAEPQRLGGINLERSKLERVKVDIGKAGYFNGLSSEILHELSISGGTNRLTLDHSRLGSLDLSGWSTTHNEWGSISMKNTAIAGSLSLARPTPKQGVARKYRLPFYEKPVELVITAVQEKHTAYWDSGQREFHTGFIAALEYRNQLFRLNARSPVIHEAGGLLGLSLNKKNASSYLNFFCNFVWSHSEGEPSAFRVLTGESIRPLETSRVARNDSFKTLSIHCERISDSHNEESNIQPTAEQQRLVEFGLIDHPHVFDSIEDAAKSFKYCLDGFKDFNIPDPAENKPMPFSRWLEYCAAKNKIDKTKDNEESERENQLGHSNENFFIPATVLYSKHIFLALFELSPDSSVVKMVDDVKVTRIVREYNSSKEKEPNKDQENDHDSDTDNSFLLEIEDFSYFDRGSPYAAVVQLNPSDKGEKHTVKTTTSGYTSNEIAELADAFLPLLAKQYSHESKPQRLEPQEHNYAERIWHSIERKAIVDLSDSSCGLLDDGSGSCWGDEVFFKTDRFLPKVLRRYADYDDKETMYFQIESSDTKRSRRDALFSDFSKTVRRIVYGSRYIATITQDIDLSPTQLLSPSNGEKKNSEIRRSRFSKIMERPKRSYYNPDFDYKEKRLLWLSRYQTLTNEHNVAANHIDRNAFKRVAKNYRALGLDDAANYIDEARIHRQYKESRRELLRNTISKKKLLIYTRSLALISLVLLFGIELVPAPFHNFFWAAVPLILGWYISKSYRWIGFGIQWISHFTYKLTFRYGLSVVRPLCTIIAFIGFGWIGAYLLDKNDFLVLESTIVTPIAASPSTKDLDSSSYSVVMPKSYAPESYVKPTDIRCGDTVDYGIYAIDMFIPLIELDQAERCLIRPFDPENSDELRENADTGYLNIIEHDCSGEGREGARLCNIGHAYKVIVNHPTTWRIAQTVYVLLGWLIVSATVFIASVSMRRRSLGDSGNS